jgi:hypothetical protein
MLRDEKLDFWLKNGFNVLFVGKHGVGKTAMIKECFTRNGLVLGETFLYFSAATLDPWVDLVGVPKERVSEDGTPYLDLVRPPFTGHRRRAGRVLRRVQPLAQEDPQRRDGTAPVQVHQRQALPQPQSRLGRHQPD